MLLVNYKNLPIKTKIYNSESYLKEDNNGIDTMQDLLDNDTIREYGIPNNTYTYESYPD